MNEALRVLFRVLGQLVWLIVRLAILALTGNWIRSRSEAEEALGELADEQTFSELGQAALPELPLEVVDDLDARVAALQQRVQGKDRLQVLQRFVDKELPVLAKRLRAQAQASEASRRRAAVEVYQQLQIMLQYLDSMIDQRESRDLATLGDADRMAAECFQPLRMFADAQQVPLASRTQVSVYGEWGLSIDLSFRDTSLAVIRLPEHFDESPYAWPAIAHELAHDFYFSVSRFEHALHQRLKLPRWQPLPASARDYMSVDVDQLFGAWLSELFADTVGALQLGPAYGLSMLHLFSDRDDPEFTRMAYGEEGYLGPHPPRALRLRWVADVVDYLGLHAEAKDLREQWDKQHSGLDRDIYLLPAADGSWLQLPAEVLEAPAQQLLKTLWEERWPRLASTRLLDIPGFAYLHAEHARVTEMVPRLAGGQRVSGRPPEIIAAAVLAAHGGAAEHRVMAALRQSVRGLGTSETAAPGAYARPHDSPYARPNPGAYERPNPGAYERPNPGAYAGPHADAYAQRGPRRASALAVALRNPVAVREALILGEALSTRRRS